ncbi:unnamed protein product, partial [Durusdinium trenchii]
RCCKSLGFSTSGLDAVNVKAAASDANPFASAPVQLVASDDANPFASGPVDASDAAIPFWCTPANASDPQNGAGLFASVNAKASDDTRPFASAPEPNAADAANPLGSAPANVDMWGEVNVKAAASDANPFASAPVQLVASDDANPFASAPVTLSASDAANPFASEPVNASDAANPFWSASANASDPQNGAGLFASVNAANAGGADGLFGDSPPSWFDQIGGSSSYF